MEPSILSTRRRKPRQTININVKKAKVFDNKIDKLEVERNAGLKYIAVCFIFAMVLTAGAIFNESNNLSNIPYQIIIFMICSGPFFLKGTDPRHRLLAIFMACYYMIFGMSNFFDIILGLNSQLVLGGKLNLTVESSILTVSDLVVIFGGLSFLVGYFLYTGLRGNRKSTVFVKDWKPETLFIMALLLWSIGFVVSVAYNMIVTPMHIPTHVMGIPLSLASNLRLLSPVASLMLIYLVAKGEYKPKMVWLFLILIIAVEFVIGFLANSKEVSYRIPALLLLGLFYMQGSFNKKILIIVFITTIPYMLFFDAYRTHVLLGKINQTQTEAFQSFDKNLDTVMKSISTIDNVAGGSLESLKQRINGKIYIDIIVAGTDSGRVPHLGGETLTLFFKTFIPRMFWPEKPSASIGQKFNQAFSLSESKFTFVPTTQLGELYWNFAMPGVIFGMLCIGLIFGFMASMFSVGMAMTLPRFLILLLATYYLALRFEANIAQQYSVFIRLVIMVALLNWFVKISGWHQRNKTNSTHT